MSTIFKAILFDLDGTLIKVDLKRFIPGYLKLIAGSISHLVPANEVIKKLLKASEAVNKNSGQRTNEEIFIEEFFPIDGYNKNDIQPLFDNFYKTKFSELSKFTKRKPEARLVMETVFKKGYEVVIATTPVLPLTAIQQRLEWAGVGDFKYRLITTIENSRANKPNLNYYKQVVTYLGFSASECLMIGDEEKDMVAKNIGCETFLVHSSNTELSSNTPKPDYKGTLKEVLDVI